MNYQDRLKEEVEQIKKSNPNIEKMLDKIKEINQMYSRDFDYEIERQHLLYKTVSEFLNK